MTRTVRASVAIGAAAVTVAALTGAAPPPATTPAPAVASQIATPPMRLAAAAQPLAIADLPNLLQRLFVPPSADAAFPQPQFPPVVVGNSLGTFIENAYNAVEPWVQWGFEVAEYAVGWIPYVGWLAPQIMIFYNTGEQIARSITFNFADWIDGQISFGQGLVDIGVDTVNAFIYFANAQIAFWLPPLPPIPPIGPFAAATTEAEQDASTMRVSFAEHEESEPVENDGSEPLEPAGESDPGGDEELETAADISDADISDVQISPAPTTGSNGTVSAQGEVRGPAVPSQETEIDATTADDTDTDTDEAAVVTPAAPQQPSDTDTEAADTEEAE